MQVVINAEFSFNSMKVRLKRRTRKNEPNTATLFQFHEGPIKTTKKSTMIFTALAKFQFHEGPIKTLSSSHI